MFSSMIRIGEASFPKSFQLLQQEAFLANSCILTGFEFMVKGGFDDRYKEHYYTSFFQISIGIERILKLIFISNYMLENSYQPPNDKELRSLGHNLITLYEKATNISEQYDNSVMQKLEDESIRKNILIFMDSFATATGRYHNISNIEKINSVDPLDQWKKIIDQIKCENFSENMHFKIENEAANHLNLELQMQDIVENTGYVHEVYRHILVSKANYYAVWNTLELIKPLINVLKAISWKADEKDTTHPNPNNHYPHIPDYSEIFLFFYSDRKSALRRKRWTDLGI